MGRHLYKKKANGFYLFSSSRTTKANQIKGPIGKKASNSLPFVNVTEYKIVENLYMFLQLIFYCKTWKSILRGEPNTIKNTHYIRLYKKGIWRSLAKS